MGRVRIPPVLRDAADGAREVEATGATVSALLADLFERRPALGARLTDERGHLSSYVNVYLNDKDIRLLDGPHTAVGPEDVVILLPAMAGGSSGSAGIRRWPGIRRCRRARCRWRHETALRGPAPRGGVRWPPERGSGAPRPPRDRPGSG